MREIEDNEEDSVDSPVLVSARRADVRHPDTRVR
jgi:hypothetical protein